MFSVMFAGGTLRQRDKARPATQLPDPAAYRPHSPAAPAGAKAPLKSVASAPNAGASADVGTSSSPRSKSAPPTCSAPALPVPIPVPRLARTLSGSRIAPVAQRCRAAINDIARRAVPPMPRVNSFEDFENNFL